MQFLLLHINNLNKLNNKYVQITDNKQIYGNSQNIRYKLPTHILIKATISN